MPEVSIIIRTKNEERWIGHCLTMIYCQDYTDFEVIVVDNQSTDHTVEIAKRFPLGKIISIERFFPGKAINDGIRASTGRFIVCLSAHCVPKEKSWLRNLRGNFDSDQSLAGVYGRQLPTCFTDALDKRDLLIVFGQDRRVQVKDYFFHNANSMVRRDVWKRFPFDETVTNIEDRVWGKAITQAGYHIVYDPEAAVYHHHGLHQGNTPQRAKGVVSIIEQIDEDLCSDLPDSMRPGQANIVAVVPVQNRPESGTMAHSLLTDSIRQLKESKYIKNIYLVGLNDFFAKQHGVLWVDRAKIDRGEQLGLDELLKESLCLIEAKGDYPDAILYVNYDYLHRPNDLFDELIRDMQYKGYETVFPGLVDYGHYWFKNGDGEYKQTDTSLKNRSDRDPIFRALYGLGCVTSSSVIRHSTLVGKKVGILPISDLKQTIRLRDVGDVPLLDTRKVVNGNDN